MLFRPKPPMIDAYQFLKTWESDYQNWPTWVLRSYENQELNAVDDSKVIAAFSNKAIFLNDYVYIKDGVIVVVPEDVFEQHYEAVS